jgi:asparagine synthase (glutamine-hydrolysing)
VSRSGFLIAASLREGRFALQPRKGGWKRLGSGVDAWLIGNAFDTCGAPISVSTGAQQPGFLTWSGDFLFINRPTASRLRVHRDPGCSTPCYWTRSADTLLFGSDAATLLAAAGKPAGIDRLTLAQALRYPDLRGEQTCLTSVCELLPGQSLEFDPAGEIRSSTDWLPRHWQAAEGDPAGLVRRAVLDSVRSSLNSCSNPVTQLSGGLDSAVVAAAAVSLGAALPAINLVTAGPEGDERPYARAIARHLGIQLHERLMTPEGVDVLASRASFLARPTHRLFAQTMDAEVQQLAAEFGHDAILTGGGGDSVFSYLLAGHATADPLSGFRLRAAFSTGLDEAMVEQVSLWRILRKACGHAFLARPWRVEHRFLAPDLLALTPPAHPWREAAKRWPPGKRAHIDALVAIQNYTDGGGRAAVPLLFPLLQKPLVSACLAIPSPHWVAGGRNRSVARAAFEDLLPPSIIRRRNKGTYERFTAQLFERNRERLRDHLLGGVLRDLELLDVAALETWFASLQPIRTNRLLAFAEAESWCRHWLQTR